MQMCTVCPHTFFVEIYPKQHRASLDSNLCRVTVNIFYRISFSSVVQFNVCLHFQSISACDEVIQLSYDLIKNK